MRQLMHILDGVNLRVSNGDSGLWQPAKVRHINMALWFLAETWQTLCTLQPIEDGTECAIAAIG